jgi:hypothetical protein
MNLNELFKNSKKVIAEGGNVSSQSPGWQGAADQEAEEIDLKIHNRDFMVGQLQELLAAQNESFKAAYGKYIWEPKLLNSGKMFSGSSLQFFDVKGVNTQDFLNKLKKTKVGDIDTQINQDMGEEVTAWLKSIIGKKVGNGTFLGFNSSLSSIWLLDDPQVRIQVDYELGPYDAKTNAPTEWFAYSHSSHYDDMAAGIKGVFHKYINRALSQAQTSTKYVARVLKKGVKISDAPVTDSDYSFAVTSAQGGGMSVKYKPYMDPATGQPMEKDGVPVMQLLEPKDRDYIQNLDQQFQINFDRKRTAADQKLQGSFVGTIQLMNKSFTTEQNEAVARAFLDILFGPGGQMITKDDPERDRDIKFAAVDAMLLGGDGNAPLKVSNGKGMRQEAVDMAMAYANAFKAKAAGKTPLAEAEVKAQLRKGMPHLRDLKPADFLDLVDELRAEGGGFKLQNIPLNVKIDGFGGRFGKNAEGKPFMGTSRTEPKYQAGFVKYHQEKGTTDPEILGRAANFDKLFNEVMAAIQMVDSKLGADFLVDKQVTCEILFLPFATQTDEGKLKFVGIEYDQLPQNVDLVLVPYRIVDAGTGEDIPDGDNVVQQIAELGQSGNVMFMSNRLVQDEGLDVTEIINPLENLDELKQIVSDTAGKRDRASLELRREVEAKLKPVQIALEKAIDEDPNIVGKDMLGQDYEGIVINSRLGPIKVTSQRQKDIISQKNAAKAAARADQGRDNANRTAVVAIGSFVGHRGHEELWKFTRDKAAEVGGDPYLFIGNAEGKDDPIPPSVKVQTWHKLYPNLANNISTVMQGGSLLQKIKHELINPLPGKPPRYDNIIIMVGEDRATMPIAAALMKAVNKFQGYEHVKATLEPTPRGTGMSFTKLRNILKDPNATPEQQYDLWSQGFDEAKLGKDWILHLMDITRKGMGVQQPQVQQPAPVAEQRLFNALVRPERINELDVSKTLNFATKAHKGQQYGEKPYITHPRSVAATGKKFFGAAFTPDAIKVALLHDVVEDTPYKLKQLTKMGYSPEVVQAVELLTKNKALSYADNIRAIIASGNKLAMMVKYADNYQNFTGDKSSWDPARAAHSQKKYLASLDMLGDKLGVTKHLSQSEIAEGVICPHCEADPCICDDSHGFVNEERTSAAVRMQRAADRQRAKSDASLRRTPSSIPKPEPKKDEKVAELRAVEPDPTGYQKDLLTSPKNSLVVDTPGDLDWYKLGQHYPTLGTDDPHEYGQGDSDMVIVPYSEKELAGLKQKLDRLKMRYKDIGGSNQQPEIHDKVEQEHIVKVKGGYELKSKHGNKNLGKYPTKAGAEKRERQVQYFKHAGESVDNKCVPVSEDVQDIMDVLINKIIVNEAIQNNNR